MKHYSEVELLELYYIPGGLVPAIRHLSVCTPCAATFDKLQQKLHNVAKSACGDVVERKPETFWSRQRIAIMRSIEKQATPKRPPVFKMRRLAVAAILVLVVGGSGALVTLQIIMPRSSAAAVERPSPTVATVLDEPEVEILDLQVANDPWSSEELESFGEVVAWEAWVDNEPRNEDTL